jgi:hypothetical protein
MAQRLSFMLSREQVKLVHEAAQKRLATETDEELRKRWEAIIRTTSDALAFKPSQQGMKSR